MATYRFFLEKRPKQDGSVMIQLRVNVGSSSRRKGIGISIQPKFWDEQTQTVYGIKRAETYNRILSDIKEQLEDMFDELALTEIEDETAECKRILEIATKGKKKKRQTFYMAVNNIGKVYRHNNLKVYRSIVVLSIVNQFI